MRLGVKITVVRPLLFKQPKKYNGHDPQSTTLRISAAVISNEERNLLCAPSMGAILEVQVLP